MRIRGGYAWEQHGGFRRRSSTLAHAEVPEGTFGAGRRAKLVDGGTIWYGRPVRGCRASIVAALLFLPVTIASPLRAAEPTNDAGTGIVVFAVDPKSKDAEAMIEAVRAHLTGLPVRLVIDPTGVGAQGSDSGQGSWRIGTLTIDPGTPGEWVVSFTEPAIDTTLVRRIRVKPQAKRVALEEAAIVVRSMVEAILDGGHVGIARPRVEEPPGAAPGSNAPWRSRRGIAATAAYLGTTFASELGWQSGGLLGLRWQSSGLYAGLGIEIFATLTTNRPGTSILLVRHPGVVFVGYEGASRVAPTIELELMADYVTRSNAATAEGYEATPPSSRWFFGVGAMAGLSWSFLPRFRLLAQGGADWVINPYSYVIEPDGGVVVRPTSIRPKIAIGLGIDVL
jgi:hypothetical protein